MSFAGLRVLSLESRRAKEMEALIRRLDGDPFVAPSVVERALDDNSEAIRFVEQLEAGDFDLLICMTGAGLTFLREMIAPQIPVERLGAALRKVAIISRGPKPLPILREMGVPVAVVVPEPNTWKEIVDAVAVRSERKVSLQEYGRPNLALQAALAELGATVTPFAIYRWDMPPDLEPLREAARRVAAGQVDVVIFTSSIQLDHLLEIAQQLGIQEQVLNSLRKHLAVASVGPVMTDSLEQQAIPADIIPNHPKMAALVRASAEFGAEVLARKRGLIQV